jgi:hypothetical protein
VPAPQVAEAHRLVRGLPSAAARAQAQADLEALGLAEAEARYPHELSGGMAQRVAIAAARAGGAGSSSRTSRPRASMPRGATMWPRCCWRPSRNGRRADGHHP